MTWPGWKPPAVPEWAVVLAMTGVAAALRLAHFGRLGLDHFDEGIYAAAGVWSLQPGGLGSIDPGLIPYAPPGYPILVGLAYALIGMSDRSAIFISILAGVATIPLVGWLGRRTIGPGGGVVASAFAAMSGMHVVFSRMAMTDATFLLSWVIGIGLGGRFLERPGPGRAVALGLAVGVAQLVKYNGWLVGSIVFATAVFGMFVSTEERSSGRLFRAFGWGLLAIVVACLAYWPWMQFVESHGGYSELLKHQRGYLGDLRDWPRHLATQLRERTAFSTVLPYGSMAALLGLAIARVVGRGGDSLRLGVLAVIGTIFLLGPGTSGWWIGLALAWPAIRASRPAIRLLGVWWIALSILTPLYHPYARLWLPLEAAGWLFQAKVVTDLARTRIGGSGWTEPGDEDSRPARRTFFLVTVVLGLCLLQTRHDWTRPRWAEFADPRSDSHRTATIRLLSAIPPGVATVQILGRPTIRFYAGPVLASRRVGVEILPGPDTLLGPGGRADRWAVVDSAQLRQEGPIDLVRARILERWEVVAEEPSLLSPATLLDIDPNAAVGDPIARSCPLLLLRRKPEATPP